MDSSENPVTHFPNTNLDELQVFIGKQRENAFAYGRVGDRGRYWAIFVTELEKAYAIGHTYGLSVEKANLTDS